MKNLYRYAEPISVRLYDLGWAGARVVFENHDHDLTIEASEDGKQWEAIVDGLPAGAILKWSESTFGFLYGGGRANQSNILMEIDIKKIKKVLIWNSEKEGVDFDSYKDFESFLERQKGSLLGNKLTTVEVPAHVHRFLRSRSEHLGVSIKQIIIDAIKASA